MKTIVVLSDTHGYRQAINKLYGLFKENDYIIHLGDGNRDMLEVYRDFPKKTYVCQGNCDYSTIYSKSEWEIQIEGCKFFCTHGHKYSVKTTLEYLTEEAKKRNASAALYGHTHIATIEKKDNILICNPGCAGLYTSQPSYAYIVVNGNRITSTIVPILP